MFVARRMQRNVVTVLPSTPLAEARRRLRGHNIRQLPVVDGENRLVGLLSDRDLREATLPVSLVPGATAADEEKILAETPVEKVMTRKVVTATLLDSLEDAMILLYDFKVNALPVVNDQGQVAGIISRTDILKAFLEALGVGEVSSRLEVVVPDRPGGLLQVISIIKSFNVNITSLLTTGHEEEGMRAVFLRIATLNTVPIKKAIREAGYRILDPSEFHL